MIKRLHAILDKPARVGVGLMSGTSADGIDAVLARLHGCGPGTRLETLAFASTPWPAAVRTRILEGFAGPAELVCQLNVELAESFATTALEVIARGGMRPDQVDFVASHGQTLHHIPPGTPGRTASTLQVGDGATIAARTGLLTITDFRLADMAAGGGGAPLVPLFDFLVLHDPAVRRVAVNIGGIANITRLESDPTRIVAFDTGPGNCLIDVVAGLADPSQRYDEDGRLAAAGRVDESLLAELRAHPYLRQPPPKSTGRELFSPAMARALAGRWAPRPLPDLIATLTAFSAASLAMGVRDHCPGTQELVVGGGGLRNPVLMAMLAHELPGVRLRSVADFGIDPDAKEALAFALLGNETLHGRAGNLPSATGARRGAVLGKLSLP